MGGGGGLIGNVLGGVEHTFSNVVHFLEHTALDIIKDSTILSLDVFTLGGGQFDLKFGNNVYYNLSGEKSRDMRRLDSIKGQIDYESNLIKNAQSRLDNKVFLENAFKYVDRRKIEDLNSEYTNLVNKYNNVANNIKDHQFHGIFEGIIALPFTITSSFVYSIRDYLETGNSKYLVQAIEIATLTVVIILSVITMQEEITVPLVLAALSATLALDAMVNDSALLGGAFQVLDLVLNKMLGLGKYTGGLNKDNEHYQSTMMWTRMILEISTILDNIYTWVVPSTPAEGVTEEEVVAKQSELTAKISEIGSMKIAGTVTLSQIFDAYQLANNIGSVADAIKLKGELEDKLKEAKKTFEHQIIDENRRKMESAYADAEYIANQVDLVYSEYALQMSEQNMTDIYDPEGTIAMNTRFRPQPKYTFGFEDIFNEDTKAGSDMYVYNILWRT
jgi:hypothetical protein